MPFGVAPIEVSYNELCTILEKYIECTFENKVYIDDEKIGKGRKLLKNVAGSFANKLYVEKVLKK